MWHTEWWVFPLVIIAGVGYLVWTWVPSKSEPLSTNARWLATAAAVIVSVGIVAGLATFAPTTIGRIARADAVESASTVFVGLKDPQEWFDSNGRRYPQSNHAMSLVAPLTMKANEWHSLNPCTGARSQPLVNATMYVEFEKGVEVKPDGWWQLHSGTDSGGLEYVGHLTPINTGECAGGQAVLRFKAPRPGVTTIGYTVTSVGFDPFKTVMQASVQ